MTIWGLKFKGVGRNLIVTGYSYSKDRCILFKQCFLFKILRFLKIFRGNIEMDDTYLPWNL